MDIKQTVQKGKLNMTQTQSLQNTWSEQDKANLAKALTFCFKMQKTYGQDLAIEDRINGWSFALEDIPMSLILPALKDYLKNNQDMPVPADINKLINPAPRRITDTEYHHAKEQWKLAGFPQFSKHKDVIDAYQGQSEQNIKAHERTLGVSENLAVKEIISSTAKQLSN